MKRNQVYERVSKAERESQRLKDIDTLYYYMGLGSLALRFVHLGSKVSINGNGIHTYKIFFTYQNGRMTDITLPIGRILRCRRTLSDCIVVDLLEDEIVQFLNNVLSKHLGGNILTKLSSRPIELLG